MKPSIIVLASFVFGLAGLPAQTTTAASAVGQTGVPAPTTYRVVESGANHSVWQRETYEAGPNGEVVTHVHKYTELATGLNHLVNGQWKLSKEEIVILPNGTAAATNGQHQAYFPGDIYSGTIRMVTPDELLLRSRPVGMSYDDGTNAVMIAELTNSIGYLVGSNQVIYPNAFTGFKADLRYTYTKAGFEQDVILRQQPPTPESLGLNADTAKLQVLTEFFSPPQPAIKSNKLAKQAGLALDDQSLEFGQMQMGQGRTFLLGQNATDSGASVAKQWMRLNGRQLLVEEVPVDAIVDGLAALPLTAINSGSSKSRLMASGHPALPPQRLAKNDTAKTVMLARAESPAQGFVLDYQALLASQNNYTFRSDTTYYVTGSFQVTGITTFEGGTVIKYPNHLGGQERILMHTLSATNLGSINCKTSSYRPAIFTASDDNSVGETISGSNGQPGLPNRYYAYGSALYWTDAYQVNPQCLHDLRFTFIWSPINITDGRCDFLIRDCQFITAYPGYYSVAAGDTVSDKSLTIQNVLFQNAHCCVGYSGYKVNAEHLTAHNTDYFAIGTSFYTNSTFSLTNSLLIGVTNLSGHINPGYTVGFVGANNATNSSDTGVFATVGAGANYLAPNSPYHNAGTTNISPSLLADIATKTTYPPAVYSNTIISVPTTLSPQAQRDYTGNPDLGYHYDPIDYELTGCSVTNATLTLTNGVAVAVFGTNCLQMFKGSQIVSVGTPLAPNWIVHSSMVQEQYQNSSTNLILADTSATVSGLFDFTKFSALAAGGYQLRDNAGSRFGNLSVQNCEFWGGINDFSGATNVAAVTLMNNLFCRSSLFASNNVAAASLFLTNNTVWGTTVTLQQPGGGLWTAFNNDFDTCTVGGTLTNGFNGYLNDTGRLLPTNSFDVVSAAALAYQPGSLGTFYQPPNSPLIDAGSTTADTVGLYQFTTQTNQSKETNSMVDIGCHYVATDADGNPLDTYTAGTPDYLVDTAGNGMDTNGLPYWWEGMYFFQVGLDPDSQDLAGNTLLYDYQYGIIPVVFKFVTIDVTNNYVNTMNAPLQLEVSGSPYYLAISVDDPNYAADANWQTYNSSNLTVNLGLTEGWHDVWIGLRGHGDDPTNAVWQYKRLKLDYTPPTVAITNPIISGGAATVTQPMIQLQGFSPEAVSTIGCTVSNAAGAFADGGFVTDQFYDANLQEYTTNFFQCFDVPLTNGANAITLQVRDLAGNETVTNFTVTLDYSTATNPPAIQLYWPQDGAQVSGSQFTLRGHVSDWTATVTAQTVDTNGAASVVNALVERDGNVWADLPLGGGTNAVTLTVTDAAGNVAVTNLTVVNLPGALTIDPLSQDAVSGVSVSQVTGTCAMSGYTIWVNGVKATDNGGGAWSANNVPLNPQGGTAVIAAAAIPDTDNGGNGSSGGSAADNGGNPVNPQSAGAVNAQTQQDEQMFVYVVTMGMNMTLDYSSSLSEPSVTSHRHETTVLGAHYVSALLTNNCGGGGYTNTYDGSASDGTSKVWNYQTTFGYGLVPGGAGASDGDYETSWQQTNDETDVTCSTCPPQYYSGSNAGTNDGVLVTDEDFGAPWLAWDVWLLWWGDPAFSLCAWQYWHWQNDTEPNHYTNSWTGGSLALDSTLTRTLQTELRLRTGGKKLAGHRDLYCLNATGSKYVVTSKSVLDGDGFLNETPWNWNAKPLAAGEIQLLGQALGNDNNLWLTLPPGEDLPLPVKVASDQCTVNVTAARYHLYIGLSTTTTNCDITTNTPEVCVGQTVTLGADWLGGAIPPYTNADVRWSLPEKYVNQATNYSSTCTTYVKNTDLLTNLVQQCWYVNLPGGKASVGMMLHFADGQNVFVAANGNFTIYRPSVTFPYPTNWVCHATPMLSNGWLELGNDAPQEYWMEFNAQIETKKNFPGDGNWTQLIYRDASRPFDTTSSQFWLDNSLLYNDQNQSIDPKSVVIFSDNPGVGSVLGIDGFVSVADQFKTYLIFKPGGGIWVTLGIVYWGWSGSEDWWMFTGGSVTNATYSDSDEFPVWPNISYNTKRH